MLLARAEFDRIVGERTGLVELTIDWGATAINNVYRRFYRRFGADGLFAAPLECARADWCAGLEKRARV